MTYDNWLEELPHQFQQKKNIDILIKAFSRQMDELLQVFEDMKTETSLQTATGQNLKYLGDVLSTSMKDAQDILMTASNDEITDEVYRKVLQ